MQKITRLDDKAEEAAKFYASIFKNSKIVTLPNMGNRDTIFTEEKKLQF